jgi:glutamate-5-semialdehyde dehydrogenase
LCETREAVKTILSADQWIDLVVPRGSNELVRFIQSNTRIPVLGHAEGICHIFVDKSADIEMAVRIVIDAKTQYPAACNAVETLLLHKDVAGKFMSAFQTALGQKEETVRLKCDKQTMNVLDPGTAKEVEPASNEDWTLEYGDLVLAVKTVDSLDEAVCHINKFGSHHTESIITKDEAAFDKFFAQVNSAGVYWNASTRFADGFRYGFGAEVGISTGKLHPRGPVGLEGLVTYKYKVVGRGHIVADYVGENARQFTHTDLDH